jgi:hypothetical protein
MTDHQLCKLISVLGRARDRWRSEQGTEVPDLSKDEVLERGLAMKRSVVSAPKATEFVRFVEDYIELDHVDETERAVAVAVLLAVDPDLREPLEPVLMAIVKISRLLRRRSSRDPAIHRRAPEFVLAYFLGWRNRSFDLNRNDLQGVPSNVRWLVLKYLVDSVGSSLHWLEDKVIGFPPGEDPWTWASRLLNRLIARRGRCDCWARSAALHSLDVAPHSLDRSDLPENSRRKALTCLRQHNIRAWQPLQPTRREGTDGEKWTLWRFLQRAAKGFLGDFNAARFPTGMLWDQWNVEAEEYRPDLRLLLVKIVVRPCSVCGNKSYTPTCAYCNGHPPINAATIPAQIANAHLIIADEKRCGFSRKKAWRCGCGNVHPADRCGDGCPGTGVHDRCPMPHCSEPMHPVPAGGRRGKRPRPSTVYFYEEPGAPVKSRAPSLAELFQEAIQAALQLDNAHGWKRGIILLIADGIEQGHADWIPLLQKNGEADWSQIHMQLRTFPDCPSQSSDLSRMYQNDFQPELMETFRSVVERAGHPWTLLQEYPAEATSEKEE